MIDLRQGDCLELLKDIPDGSVDLVLTDPPYGTTRNKWDSAIPMEPLWREIKRVSKRNAAIILFAQTPFDKALGASNLPMLKYEWIWEKEQATGHLNAKKAPMKIHENILVFYRKPPVYNPQMRKGFKPYKSIANSHSSNYGSQRPVLSESDGQRYPIDLIQFPRDKAKLHPTQKPVALLEYLVRTYTNEGGLVLDFTMGSGSTGVACVNTGRNFIGMELDPGYFKTAQERIEKAVNDNADP